MGEFARIARIRRLLATPLADASPIEVGIGDDCAVLAATATKTVWTIDSAVEGVHFRRDCMSLDAIGFRAFMAAASDLAAMGGRATAALSALTLPPNLGDDELDRLVAGLARAASECACPVVGGNLTRGSELSLTTTLLGAPHARPILRSGARSGDDLYVSGPLGGAALGLRALVAGRADGFAAPYVSAFLAPRARLDIAAALSRVATAALDLSDGLSQDAAHLCRASGVDAHIELDRIPRLEGFAEVCRTLSYDVVAALTAGGDDYELLFTAAPGHDIDAWATRIGRIVPGLGHVHIVDATGAPVALRTAGFDHFA